MLRRSGSAHWRADTVRPPPVPRRSPPAAPGGTSPAAPQQQQQQQPAAALLAFLGSPHFAGASTNRVFPSAGGGGAAAAAASFSAEASSGAARRQSRSGHPADLPSQERDESAAQGMDDLLRDDDCSGDDGASSASSAFPAVRTLSELLQNIGGQGGSNGHADHAWRREEATLSLHRGSAAAGPPPPPATAVQPQEYRQAAAMPPPLAAAVPEAAVIAAAGSPSRRTTPTPTERFSSQQPRQAPPPTVALTESGVGSSSVPQTSAAPSAGSAVPRASQDATTQRPLPPWAESGINGNGGSESLHDARLGSSAGCGGGPVWRSNPAAAPATDDALQSLPQAYAAASGVFGERDDSFFHAERGGSGGTAQPTSALSRGESSAADATDPFRCGGGAASEPPGLVPGGDGW